MTLKDWSFRARISRENTTSRRFSAFNLKSFREESTSLSFRSNLTISSTASSPGCTLREEIDPATFPFTTALKALQAKAMMHTWEYLDGLTLNSKWEEAEKYICNPLSGQVPVECLSAKTLSARSFRSLTSRITMSAPLIYPSHLQGKLLANSPINKRENDFQLDSLEKKRCGARDVGTQSTTVRITSTFKTQSEAAPSVDEKSANPVEYENEPSACSENLTSSTQYQSQTLPFKVELKEKEARERANLCICSSSSKGGCLSLNGLWGKTKKKKDKAKLNMNHRATTIVYLDE